MSIYQRFGVSPRINAAGPKTRLGGTLMDAEVLEAMTEAAKAYVDMAELQSAASRVIAEVTGAEAGYVTCGAAAALTLGTAACIARLDVSVMNRLPDTNALAADVIICRSHRNGYDHAIRAAGARLVEVGLNDRYLGAGVRDVEPWEIELAIDENTVAIAYVAQSRDTPKLRDVVDVAHRHGIPVIVDAAGQLPPRSNLRRFISEGADLVAFSGGKAIRGPQASGFLAGRHELIASVALQHLDMDVHLDTWRDYGDLIPGDRLPGLPQHGIGRGFKVGKEEIVGFLVAFERFVKAERDDESVDPNLERLRERAHRLAEALGGRTCVKAEVADAERAPKVMLDLFSADAAKELYIALQSEEPKIVVDDLDIGEGRLFLHLTTLLPDDERILIRRLLQVLRS